MLDLMPKINKQTEVLTELENIRRANGGVLKVQDVVDNARAENAPLHSYFEWDDSVAGEAYRLQQARQLIRATVTIIPRYSQPIIAYVSMMADRHEEGGGYRSIVEVMSDTEQRELLLTQALRELEIWQQKYQQLNDLVPIFTALEKVKNKKR